MRILDLVGGAILARLMLMRSLLGFGPNMSRVTDRISVGGTNPSELIISERFRAVLDLRAKEHLSYRSRLEDDGIRYLKVGIPDGHGASPEVLLEISEWLAEREETGEKTLVHCRLGRGRAALAVAAYLIHEGSGPEDAIETIRRTRRVIFLNKGQTEALAEFAESERRRHGEPSDSIS